MITEASAEMTWEQIRKFIINVRKMINQCIQLNGALVEATEIL